MSTEVQERLDYVEYIFNKMGFSAENPDLFYGWLWWSCQAIVQVINILVLITLWSNNKPRNLAYDKKQLYCATVYTCACFVRAIWPRNDVTNMCFFDGIISTTNVGRSLATVAELCFIAQIKMSFKSLSQDLLLVGRGSIKAHRNIRKFADLSWWFIFFAQCCCWVCVTTTFKLWSAFEESIWTVVMFVYLLIFVYLRPFLRDDNLAIHREYTFARRTCNAAIIGLILYVAFMTMVDVPMYIRLHKLDLQNGKVF